MSDYDKQGDLLWGPREATPTMSDTELLERIRVAVYRRIGQKRPDATLDWVAIAKPKQQVPFHEIHVTLSEGIKGVSFFRLKQAHACLKQHGIEVTLAAIVAEFVRDVRLVVDNPQPEALRF